jgi:filamentous hemagglutinin family protein
VRLAGWFTFVGTCVLAALAPHGASAQHITIDGRFAGTLVGPNYTIGANLGRQVGSNLFHSFGVFGLATGESATFTSAGGTGPISNVIGRVTGGTLSAIDGRIQSQIVGANFYLINPSGIVFGPNAAVNVSGSFHVSTADYVKMADGAKFQATDPNGSTLSAAPPVAFGFLTATPAAITVNGSSLTPGGPGGTLGLVGGPVSISSSTARGAALFAPAGTIHVTSAASKGEVPVDPRNTSGLTVTSFGPISIGGGSILEVDDQLRKGSGGSVFIRSGELTIDASEINADHYGFGPSGQLVLRGDNHVSLTNAAIVHSVAFGAGNGAAIAVTTGLSGVISADNALVIGGSAGPGDGGSVSAMGGQLTLTNGAQLLSVGQGSGKTGQLSIHTGQLTLSKGAQIGVGALGSATGGDVSVTVDGQLSLDSASSPFFTGISSNLLGSLAPPPQIQVELPPLLVPLPPQLQAPLEALTLSTFLRKPPQFTASGIPGNINVTAGSLSIVNSGQISAATQQPRDGGNVTVSVPGQLTIDGRSQNPVSFTGITSQSFPGSTGNAGSVVVNAGTLSIANNGVISGETFGSGHGGSVAVRVAGGLSIDGTVGDSRLLTGISSASAPGNTGSAGSVSVNASTLSILSNGMISAASFGSGNGGSVSVSAAGQLTIDGKSQNSLFGTGITSAARPGSSGDAGNVLVNAGTLSIVNKGTITSESDSTGQAGAVVVNAGTLSLSGGGLISSAATASGNGGAVQVIAQGALSLCDPGSGITASATSTGSGNAGSVAVNAPQITVTSGAQIASTTVGTGAGGSVGVTTPGALVLDGMGVLGTGIAASATGAQSGAGGDVTVAADSLSAASGAQIASKAGGLGKGGDVGVRVAGDVNLSGTAADGTASGISAAAIAGSIGGAGQVTLLAGGALSVTGGAQVSSSTSGLGNGGTVTVSSQGPLSLSSGGGILALASATASGNAGTVTVSAPQMALTSAAEIASTTAGTGNGGSVSVSTPGTLALAGGAQIAASATGLQSGMGGLVTVAANNLTVEGGAQIASTAAGPGNGGSVSVNIAGPIAIDGHGETTGITSQSLAGPGNGGDVRVRSGSLSVLNGGIVASGTQGPGNGGSVFVNAGRGISIDDGQITAASGGGFGSGGNVIVASPNLAIHNGGEISTETFGPGSGGNIFVTVSGNLAIDTSTGTSPSGILATAAAGSSGTGGNVTLSAGNLALVSGGVISTERLGSGHTGSISVGVSQDLAIDGGSGTGTTGISSKSEPGSAGSAGNVSIGASTLSISGGGQISASTQGAGRGGDVSVFVAGVTALTGSGQVSAGTSGPGQGGSVELSAQDALTLDG